MVPVVWHRSRERQDLAIVRSAGFCDLGIGARSTQLDDFCDSARAIARKCIHNCHDATYLPTGVLPPQQALTMRTTTRTVIFKRPFMLRGFDRVQPAGTYTVETDEELLDTISVTAYRRIATLIRLHPEYAEA